MFKSAGFLKAVLMALALAGFMYEAAARDAAMRPVEISTSPISHFRLGSDETRFGALEFVGGLELRSPDPEFGQLSALRFLDAGSAFIGVADHGYWLSGSIVRDENGAPAAIAELRMQPIVGPEDDVLADKEDKDAEGLHISDGIATVSFERNARVSEYAISPEGMGPPQRDLDIVIPRHELRYNRGIETVLATRDGARVAIAERSIDGNGDIFAAILEGPQKGIFKVRRSNGYDITDGALMENGDLLLLERRLSATHGVGMRLRRIPGDQVRKGALVDGPALMEADLAHRIDNMEGLDVWRRDDGATMVSIVSDDNQSFLQRTLYLEFRLVE